MNLGSGPVDNDEPSEAEEAGSDEGEASQDEREISSPRRPKRGREEDAGATETAAGEDETNGTEATPEPPVDPMLKRRRIMLIKEYFRSFPKKLEGMDHSDLESKSVEELDQYLKEVRFCIRCSSSGTLVQLGISGAVGVVEYMGTSNGMGIEGLRTKLYLDQDWVDMCKEAELEFAEMYEQPLYFRMALKLGTVCHKMYTQAENLKSVAPADNTVVDVSAYSRLNSVQ
jgi:hypothetical protein